MAGLGFKDFAVGEVLTSADVDGYLMQQTVMRFADAGARGSALGTAAGTGVPLAEGMVSYLDDLNAVQVYTGTSWASVGGFNAGTAITATDTSWTVPTLANPVVRVIVVAAGGGGGGAGTYADAGSAGTNTTFGVGQSWAISATAGLGAKAGYVNSTGRAGTAPFTSDNGGHGGYNGNNTDMGDTGHDGNGGEIKVGYVDLTGVSTVNVAIGAGGAGGAGGGGAGGAGANGIVIFEYQAV